MGHNDLASHNLDLGGPCGGVVVASTLCWEDGNVFDPLALEADSPL